MRNFIFETKKTVIVLYFDRVLYSIIPQTLKDNVLHRHN